MGCSDTFFLIKITLAITLHVFCQTRVKKVIASLKEQSVIHVFNNKSNENKLVIL